MQNINSNDFIVDILQDICETQSIITIMREAVYNENSSIQNLDIGNTLEIIISKMSNIKYALNKYIDTYFEKSEN